MTRSNGGSNQKLFETENDLYLSGLVFWVVWSWIRTSKASFMKTLDLLDAESDEESMSGSASVQRNVESIDERLAQQFTSEEVCAFCHEHTSADGGVLGLIGFAQLTKNLQLAKARLNDPSSIPQGINFAGQRQPSPPPEVSHFKTALFLPLFSSGNVLS